MRTCKRTLILIATLTTALFATAAANRAPAASHGRLFFLTLGGRGETGSVRSVNDDGTDLKILVPGRTAGPDGIVVDTATKKIYWTNMGKPSANDGTIERSDIDGSNLTTIVPAAGTWTPKQLKLDAKHGKLYWSDREGMRIMRANLDGSNIETLVETAQGDTAREDATNWCVGMAIDVNGGKMYWTQKGSGGNGRIFRANMEIPKGEDPLHRTDIEVLFAALPEPIDMDLDLTNRIMYWADRGDPPRGNTISRAPMAPPRPAAVQSNAGTQGDAASRKIAGAKGFADVQESVVAETTTSAEAMPALMSQNDQQILVTGLKEGIGMALDLKGGRMFYTDLGGNVYSAKLDGSDSKVLLSGQGALTGITWVDQQQ